VGETESIRFVVVWSGTTGVLDAFFACACLKSNTGAGGISFISLMARVGAMPLELKGFLDAIGTRDPGSR